MNATQDLYTQLEAGNLAAVTSLLDDQPELVHTRRMTGDDRSTPLQFAARHGQLGLCRLLVERGAEVYTNPFNTYPPVIEAAWKEHQEVVDYFLQEIPDRASGTNGLGVALNLAARQGWQEIVAAHLAQDPLAVHQRGWIGDTPLHWPSHNNYADIVKMLLDAGAAIEADEINCYGGKPLHWASEHAPASVKVLLEAGADPNSRNVKAGSDFEGVTPLIMNATQRNDCAEVTGLLLAAGAEIGAVDAKGKTAWEHATERGLTRILAVLKAAGAG